MRDVTYWPSANRLVYFAKRATPEFWNERWQAEGPPPPVGPEDEVRSITPKYLEPGAKVLEGGCGRGHKVKAMFDDGFDPVGLDFADDTVRRAKECFPELDLRQGDVRALPFADSYFDGYWSIGVIEHFWRGYDSILSEAARVLRPDGMLFLTAPWFSPLRYRKARKGGYAVCEYRKEEEPDAFYQFALAKSEITHKLSQHGFRVVRWQGLASEISLAEDSVRFRRLVDWLFASRGSLAKRVFRRALTSCLNGVSGHSFLVVARRVK